MGVDWQAIVPLIVLGVLSVVLAVRRARRPTNPPAIPWAYLWAFFLVFGVAEWVSFSVAVWILALLSFHALREYFSLLDLRLADRWGILGAYLSIPGMTYLIQINWYGFFIISIPVYVFLVIPFLVALGGPDPKGSVLSVGAIDFGLFFFVFCLGHVGYLVFFSRWMAILVIVGVTGCDALLRALGPKRPFALRYVACAAFVLVLAWGLRSWTWIPSTQTIAVGLFIPGLVLMGRFTLEKLEADLGIGSRPLEPGRGLVVDSLRSYLFTAPVIFHYLRWSLRFGDRPWAP
jgi:phosphatidate cytidylyltransferase